MSRLRLEHRSTEKLLALIHELSYSRETHFQDIKIRFVLFSIHVLIWSFCSIRYAIKCWDRIKSC